MHSIRLEKFIIIFSLITAFGRDFLTFFLKKEINIENPIKYFENDLDFSGYSTTIKPIAIYNLDSNIMDYNPNNIINDKQLKEENLVLTNELEELIHFTKSHGIYGFAFYYSLYHDNKISYLLLENIIKNKSLKINFLIIIEKITIKLDIYALYSDIMKYFEDRRYIKIFNKYAIGLKKDSFNKNDIIILRKTFKKHKLGEIFILSFTNNYNHNKENFNNNIGFCFSPPFYSLPKIKFHYNNTNSYFFTHLIYNNLLNPPLNNSNSFRMSIALSKYPIFIKKNRTYIYWDYSPEKFYFLNKIIMNWTKINYNKDNQFIFIDNFSKLKKDNILGYANINSFSKALYNLPFIIDNNKNISIFKLEKQVLILIQVHVYYIDLLSEIIDKTNNIPYPFDLYITSDTQKKKTYIENSLKAHSKANKFQILITPNKGRDVIPFLIQLKDILMKYKYLCHIHTKKNGINSELGKYWQNYLYENLLGNKSIITQILRDFENNNELGFIFPEHFYPSILDAYAYKYSNWYHLNRLFDILFPNMKFKPGNNLNFPVGNMFWARTHAIYQIFDERIIKLVPEESGQKDGTILHAIERFWLYLVKLNGFNYKTVLYNI